MANTAIAETPAEASNTLEVTAEDTKAQEAALAQLEASKAELKPAEQALAAFLKDKVALEHLHGMDVTLMSRDSTLLDKAAMPGGKDIVVRFKSDLLVEKYDEITPLLEAALKRYPAFAHGELTSAHVTQSPDAADERTKEVSFTIRSLTPDQYQNLVKGNVVALPTKPEEPAPVDLAQVKPAEPAVAETPVKVEVAAAHEGKPATTSIQVGAHEGQGVQAVQNTKQGGVGVA